MARLRGLIAATFTPMDEGGALRLELVPELVERLVRDGVRGLFVSGSTGEGACLTADERRAAAEAYVAAAAGRLPVIVQVGHSSLREARGLAAHARAAGATAVAIAPPTYFRPRSVEALVRSLAEVAAGAPDLPAYYYHIPALTGVAVDVARLLGLAPARLPQLAGVKYSVANPTELKACIELDGGRFEMLFGCDEMLMTGLCLGAQAAIGSTYNFAAPLYGRVVDACARGDLAEARRAQALAVAMVDVLLRHGGLPAFKATMGLVGPDVGPTRLPNVPLDDAAREALRRDLERIGFFAWARPAAADSADGPRAG